MYKINRISSNVSNKHSLPTTPFSKRILFSKTNLTRDLKDFNTLLNKHSLDRINSMKRLTKENIDQFNFQRLKNKNLNSANNHNTNDANDRQVYHNSILPKIPDYKPMNGQKTIKEEKLDAPMSLEEAQKMLVNRKVQSQEDMAKVFNAIINGDAIQPNNQKVIEEKKQQSKTQQKNRIEQNNGQNSKQTKDNNNEQQVLIQQDESNIKLNVLKQLKQKIINDDHVDYNQIYEICNNLYKQFPKNSMVKSILMRAVDRFNRSQFYKIPDDKIKQLVEIVILNIKKIYK